jgi:transposase
VVRIRRPKYGCRACGTIHQAPAPERVIAKGLASPALLAHVLIGKYCDHTPLYRQAGIFDAARRTHRTIDARRLDRRRLLVAGAIAGAYRRPCLRRRQGVR